MAKPALGKGFDALINQNLSRESLAAPQAGDVVHQLSHASIIPSSLQPRAIFTPEQLAELVDSIKEHGIIQPLIVRKTESGKYELIAGESAGALPASWACPPCPPSSGRLPTRTCWSWR